MARIRITNNKSINNINKRISVAIKEDGQIGFKEIGNKQQARKYLRARKYSFINWLTFCQI